VEAGDDADEAVGLSKLEWGSRWMRRWHGRLVVFWIWLCASETLDPFLATITVHDLQGYSSSIVLDSIYGYNTPERLVNI
jgi:hypothetical protein